MTVAALTETRVQIMGDGVSNSLSIPWQFVDEHDLTVIHTSGTGIDTEWIYQQSPGQWDFTGGNYSAGAVTFNATDLPTGDRLTVVMTSQYDQDKTLSGGEIDPVVIERSLDGMALSIQAIASNVKRGIFVSPSLEGDLPNLELPDLPDGHGIVRYGEKLVSAPIDSGAISAAVTAAQVAKAAAETAKAGAEAAQISAGTSATNASGSASTASTARTAAQVARDKAQNWADEAEDTEVDPGKYSAMHWAAKAAAAITSLSLTGAVVPFAMSSPPSGWLECNGAAISRTVYADLFAAIGTAWGVGDGTTTFNLPDYRGKFFRGWDNGAGIDGGRVFGDTQGDAIANHSHNVSPRAVGSSQQVNVAQGVAGIANPKISGETRPVNETALVCVKY